MDLVLILLLLCWCEMNDAGTVILERPHIGDKRLEDVIAPKAAHLQPSPAGCFGSLSVA